MTSAALRPLCPRCGEPVDVLAPHARLPLPRLALAGDPAMVPAHLACEPADPRAFRCPRCGAVSHNPNDRREGYCGRCHRFVEEA